MAVKAGPVLVSVCLLSSITGQAVLAQGTAQETDTSREHPDGSGPDPASDLCLTAPIARWDEAIPLGNGIMGGLLWGEGNVVKLSLDRGDLWDLRRPDMLLRPDWNYATMRRLAAERNQPELSRMFDEPYNDSAYPTKLPVGRLELTLGAGDKAESFGLDLRRAVGHVQTSAGGVEVFFSANEPVALIRVAGAAPACRLVASDAVKQLGYPPAGHGSENGVSWFVQEAALGLKYAVVAGLREEAGNAVIGLAVTSSQEDADPLALGRKRVADALAKGFDVGLAPHAAWWRQFWSVSGVRVPDRAIQQQYDLVQYFYGAASRRGAPPMPLQGVWTADEGTLPPWKGDYHHDLNTQLTYWAYLAAGHFEEGACFLDFMWNLLPEHREFARVFYGTSGAAVPGVMTLDGKAMGGWGQYSLSPTNGAWVAQAFYLHWRYTKDGAFLAERAYPYLAALGECYEELLKPDSNGKLKLPLSSSPEIHDNTLRAWLTPNSNFDLALLKWHFSALAEMALELKDATAADRWQGTLRRLDDFAVEGGAGPLRLSADESLSESHRHHSHLMAIHPLGLLNIEQSDRERGIIDASLAQNEQLGTRNWCGYSFSWMSCMMARAGKPDRALKNLEVFVQAFLSPNGFHLNGDQKGGSHSNFTYRPFTLEGNFAAAQAVHEMLLQSWGGCVRVFPAVAPQWADVSFFNLRAEGAFVVSAKRERGQTVWVRVTTGKGGMLRLRDPFGGESAAWTRPDVTKDGPDYLCTLQPGAAVEARQDSRGL
ncbi:MAG: glycoside hydrolase N-terminal domain-containing protein [Candidatus Hydrogenedentes bacterium]|nr:glycoside hydrolase N-terminal domain-containing protein [Candidatus Hydrogenedentota bacterium]